MDNDALALNFEKSFNVTCVLGRFAFNQKLHMCFNTKYRIPSVDSMNLKLFCCYLILSYAFDITEHLVYPAKTEVVCC